VPCLISPQSCRFYSPVTCNTAKETPLWRCGALYPETRSRSCLVNSDRRFGLRGERHSQKSGRTLAGRCLLKISHHFF
jgi:hypothetical protein